MMQNKVKYFINASLLSIGLISVSSALAYTKGQEQILAATTAWQQAVDQHNPQAIAALYDAHAYFYPTFTNEITSPQALLAYFVNLSKKPELAVVFDQENPRVYHKIGINSGLYTFSYQDQGKKVEVPARFTFIYQEEQGKWLIIEHHSSLQPEAAGKA